jgi:Rrf2 family protein
MLSHKSKYALKAAIALAREFGQGPVLISDIAQRERIPRKFLELILLELRHSGILQSRKGKGGGYFLAREPASVTLGEILRVVEGSLAPMPCVSKTAYLRCSECRDENSCGIRMVMKEVRDATARIVDSTTLADVLDRVAMSVSGKEPSRYAN